MQHPVIYSLSGTSLTGEEAAFFKDTLPAGYILFRRNIDTPDQVRKLTSGLKNIHGGEVPILIDQEGGTVQRLRAPHFIETPGMRSTAACSDEEFCAYLRQQAAQLSDLGFNVNCVPVLDVPKENSDTLMIPRTFSDDPEVVAARGALVCQEMFAAGIKPVLKHMPGIGLSQQDSHVYFPEVHEALDVLDKRDFVPFRKVVQQFSAQGVWGMVGHINYTAIDADLPASLSPKVIDVIRRNIGFTGMLLSDDLSMGALDKFGDIAERARTCLKAGCDLALYCKGEIHDMRKISEALL